MAKQVYADEVARATKNGDQEVSAQDLSTMGIRILGGDSLKQGDEFLIPEDYKVLKTAVNGSKDRDGNQVYAYYVLVEKGESVVRVFLSFFNRYAWEVNKDIPTQRTGNVFQSSGQPCDDFRSKADMKAALDLLKGHKIKVTELKTVWTYFEGRSAAQETRVPTLEYVEL